MPTNSRRPLGRRLEQFEPRIALAVDVSFYASELLTAEDYANAPLADVTSLEAVIQTSGYVESDAGAMLQPPLDTANSDLVFGQALNEDWLKTFDYAEIEPSIQLEPASGIVDLAALVSTQYTGIETLSVSVFEPANSAKGPQPNWMTDSSPIDASTGIAGELLAGASLTDREEPQFFFTEATALGTSTDATNLPDVSLLSSLNDGTANFYRTSDTGPVISVSISFAADLASGAISAQVLPTFKIGGATLHVDGTPPSDSPGIIIASPAESSFQTPPAALFTMGVPLADISSGLATFPSFDTSGAKSWVEPDHANLRATHSQIDVSAGTYDRQQIHVIAATLNAPTAINEYDEMTPRLRQLGHTLLADAEFNASGHAASNERTTKAGKDTARTAPPDDGTSQARVLDLFAGQPIGRLHGMEAFDVFQAFAMSAEPALASATAQHPQSDKSADWAFAPIIICSAVAVSAAAIRSGTAKTRDGKPREHCDRNDDAPTVLAVVQGDG